MIKMIIFDWGDTLMRDFKEYSGPMAEWEKIELIAGAEEMLEKLHKKYKIVVASNAEDSDSLMMKKAFERAGIDKYIDSFYTSKELGFKKPDKNFFLEIIKREKIEIKEVTAVGNIYINDVKPVIELGGAGILFDEKNIEIEKCNKIEKIGDVWKKLQV